MAWVVVTGMRRKLTIRTHILCASTFYCTIHFGLIYCVSTFLRCDMKTLHATENTQSTTLTTMTKEEVRVISTEDVKGADPLH